MNNKRIIITVIATASALAVLGIVIYNVSTTGAREHTVTIPAGAFIPPQNWDGRPVFENRYFNPSNLTIRKGDMVRWVNRDSVTHTVTHLDSPKLFDRVLNPNEGYRMRFNREGVYVYICTIHPWQGGEIRVT